MVQIDIVFVDVVVVVVVVAVAVAVALVLTDAFVLERGPGTVDTTGEWSSTQIATRTCKDNYGP